MNTDKEKNIERYISGEMSEMEAKDFEEQMASDKELAKEYSTTLASYQLITQAGRLALKNKLESFDKEFTSTSEVKKVMPLWVKRALPIAAILIVFIGIYQFVILNNNVTGYEVYNRYYESYADPSIVRDADDSDLINWETAANYYRDKKFNDAILYFERSEGEVPQYMASFYIGMSYLAMETPDYEKAKNSFDLVLNTDNDFEQQALWYKGLILMKQNDLSEALVIFNSIVNSKGYQYEYAEEIIVLKIE